MHAVQLLMHKRLLCAPSARHEHAASLTMHEDSAARGQWPRREPGDFWHEPLWEVERVGDADDGEAGAGGVRPAEDVIQHALVARHQHVDLVHQQHRHQAAPAAPAAAAKQVRQRLLRPHQPQPLPWTRTQSRDGR